MSITKRECKALTLGIVIMMTIANSYVISGLLHKNNSNNLDSISRSQLLRKILKITRTMKNNTLISSVIIFHLLKETQDSSNNSSVRLVLEEIL